MTIMLKVYIENVDPVQLQSRLESLLDEGGAHAPHNRYAAPPQGRAGLRQQLRRWPWLRRLVDACVAWKLSGWSLRWFVRHLPVLGPIATRIYSEVTQLEFRIHVLRELGQLSARVETLQNGLARLDATVNGAVAPAMASLQASAAGLQADTASLQAEYRALRERLGDTVSRLRDFECAFKPHTGAVPDSKLFPAWYLALENSLRGDTADIEARLAAYLPCLDAAQAGQPGRPVLDLGCGRGEWLQLLGKRGLLARGVDTNPAMLEQAHRQGLDVAATDLVAALRDTDPSSIGAVTAFQVVEHLDRDTMLELFQQAWRVLCPGGVLLLETPNPENLQVGAYSFWLDPTHVRPLPPPLLAHTAAHFGFVDIAIMRSNPWDEALRLDTGGAGARHLEKLLFSAQDYALIARKPYA